MKRWLVFSGTYEGRTICEWLSQAGFRVVSCVATEYGKEVMNPAINVDVRIGRLNQEEIELLLKEENFHGVIDATHPYAQIVSHNILNACKNQSVSYVRLLREEDTYQDVISVSNTQEAIRFMEKTTGTILVTTGSKELFHYTQMIDFQNRLKIRVLPTAEVLKYCEELGFKGDQIIAIQGPFSYDLNVAMIRNYDCNYLVTKNTGEPGGLSEKIKAAQSEGCKVILIERPSKEEGVSLWNLGKELGVLPVKNE